VIKGFIEVHNSQNENQTVLVNVRHIVDVRANVIYMDDALPTSTDFPYTACMEEYEEIKKKIKEAVGETT
jgi:hypothetical protein